MAGLWELVERIAADKLALLTQAERIAVLGGHLGAGWSASEDMWLIHVLATQAAEEGTLVAGAGVSSAVVIFPVAVVAALVWVALGSGYYQARQIVRNEGAMSGFSQGFICGLLRWSYDATLSHFTMPLIMIDVWDEENNNIRVDAYMDGLRKGFIAGNVVRKPVAKELLEKLRLLGKISQPSSASWTGNRLVQRNYVIDLAGAARKHGLVKPDR